jgi:hypothetical protein
VVLLALGVEGELRIGDAGKQLTRDLELGLELLGQFPRQGGLEGAHAKQLQGAHFSPEGFDQP